MCTMDVSVYTVVLVVKGVLEKMSLRVKEAFLTNGHFFWDIWYLK